MASSKPKSQTSFKSRLAELEQILQWFESEDVDVDESIKRFERGLELIESLEKELDTAKNKVELIKLKFK